MKGIRQFILENFDPARVKFHIFNEKGEKLAGIPDNDSYAKIEYVYRNQEKNLEIDFLLGYDADNAEWKLWAGRFGQVSYTDDPLCGLGTDDFTEAVNISVDKIAEYVDRITDDKGNFLKYFKPIK